MKLGICQMSISDDIDLNAKKIVNFLDKAREQDIDLLVFPEMSLTGYNPDIILASNLNTIVDSCINRIREKGDSLKIGAVIGHAYNEGDKLYNRLSVILPGEGIYTYDKMHLVQAEGKYFEPGSKFLTFTYKDEMFGVMICRDQNDPKIAEELVKRGAQFIFIISAHYYKPKEARWKLEKNRAIPITRAVENRVYVLLPNTVGSHLGMISLGNSLIADPDGAVVVSAGESEETILSLSLYEFEE
ncbi:MAG TPA: carbon-nitrogen hydrolase family protein [Thermoanaerobacterales bacterium]|nr:carbon-nitrogen hydrolase family protein [Thermoanaerobacterales bacterium]